MKGQVFTIAKLHYINGVVYQLEQLDVASIDKIAQLIEKTTKSGKAKHPKIRIRTLTRFADGIGLVKFIDKNSIALTGLGKEYCRLKHDDKWSLSEDQKRLLRQHLLKNPNRTKTTFAITSLLNLVSESYSGRELATKYAETIGKQNLWKSTVTFDGFTQFGLNYLQELGFINADAKLIQRDVLPRSMESSIDYGLRAGDIISNEQIVSIFKCGPQGGMRRSHRTNTLIIISDHTRSIYEDRWISNDTMHYTGMGQKGEQRLDYAQNKTLAESNWSGIIPYLFEVYEAGQYLFRGQVALAEKPFQETQPDKNGNLRFVWVFPLKIIDSDASFEVPGSLIAKKQKIKERIAKHLSDKDLFTRAVHSRKHPVNRKVASTAYERNVYVAELAKRRANGICQLCDRPAPFENKSGIPFLETHHIIWLSKGGEDTVENAVAVCPNCHRKMHILNLKSDRRKLKKEAQKTSCQLTFSGQQVFV